jgi:hypothetical protein
MLDLIILWRFCGYIYAQALESLNGVVGSTDADPTTRS